MNRRVLTIVVLCVLASGCQKHEKITALHPRIEAEPTTLDFGTAEPVNVNETALFCI